MADLNALIAQGAQFAAPVDPFAQYGKMQQLQQGETANQLNRMKMDEYQRSLQEQNALRGLDPAAADYLAKIKQINPKLGFEFEKTANEAANLRLTGLKTQTDVAQTKSNMLKSSLRDMSNNPSDENIKAHTQDYALNPLFKDELASIQANAQKLLAMPYEDRKIELAKAGATAGDLFTAESSRLGRLTTERGQNMTAGTAQQRLAFEQQKFAWEKANPGYELKEDANGGMVGVNKRTLEAVPVMVGGAAAPIAGAAAASAVNIPQMIDPKQSSKKEPIDSTDIKKYADKFFKGNIQSAIEDLKKQGWVEKPADSAAPAIVGPRTQLMGKGTALTESQGNATAFGMRMNEAHSLLKNLESKGETGTGVIGGTVGGVAGLVPLIGDKLTAGVDNIFNVLPGVLGGYSSEQQQVLNGRINFITAVLRKESGASIQPSEFATAERLYFPKPGDSDVVIKQKQKARELAIQAMKIQAGPGAKNIGAGTSAPVGSNPNDPLNLGVR